MQCSNATIISPHYSFAAFRQAASGSYESQKSVLPSRMAVVASSYLQAKVVMTARTRTQFPEAKNALFRFHS